ncbi:hypothetical protein I6E11_09575 [Bacteroides caecigallinarum]|uniref:hypothetical protein n=1 Tax=Bacteroides caecigallinarum TaxID=1411144 RepID=UPI001F45B7E8|nr:hypothetical protein [Bacteroides caecigallinarum]MCF2594027.1 hypothetical protein [Bacteroides caecigallinarum]
MKDQRVLKTETMVSSCMKETYVAPMTVAYSVQNEGVLCSSNPTGTVDDPTYGVSAGFYETGVNSLFEN